MNYKVFNSADEFANYRKRSVSREACPFCNGKFLQDIFPISWRYGRSNLNFELADGNLKRLDRYWRMACTARAQRCKKCGGSWVDIFEVRAIDLPPVVKDSDIMNKIYKTPLFCPFDHSKRPLIDKFHTVSSGLSSLIFCPSCHSTWTERSVIIDSEIIDKPVGPSPEGGIEVDIETTNDKHVGSGNLSDYHGEFQETQSVTL